MDEHALWFQQFRDSDTYRKLQARPIAYFCAEFALTDKLPIFAGGLGVLAGDVIREAADQHLPMVGVGLLYRSAVRQSAREFGPRLVTDQNGNPVTVTVPIQDRKVNIGAYELNIGTIPLYLLTSDVLGNDPRDRAIVNELYPQEKERRFQQEMILGIGGLRLLEALEIHPMMYHLNEGHSAMLALEIIQHEVRERMISFADALSLAKEHIVFTNHTLLPAGNDVFSNDLASANLAGYAFELMIPVKDIVDLGLVQESSLFSMTMLSLRLASRINAVSQLHAKKAAEIWTDHPMEGITNGIHVGTWDRINVERSDLGVRQGRTLSHIWAAHFQNKRRLLDKIQDVSGKSWDEHCLLLGWARRIVSYKQPMAMFSDPDRLLRICQTSGQPIRLVISGNIQPADEEGESTLKQIQELAQGKLSDIAVYLPHYNLKLAELMTAGCDVWLNTPVVGFEACGTSGMKACLNGVLPVSTKDGWMDEIENYDLGWTLNSDNLPESFYSLLEHEIAPLFFSLENTESGGEWQKLMANARRLILDRYSATRMLREYVEKLYLQIL